MSRTTIDRLIINSPYTEPSRHWCYERETRLFDLVEGRRPAGYVVASESSKSFDDLGIFVEIPLACWGDNAKNPNKFGSPICLARDGAEMGKGRPA